jgi:hypothetical protein
MTVRSYSARCGGRAAQLSACLELMISFCVTQQGDKELRQGRRFSKAREPIVEQKDRQRVRALYQVLPSHARLLQSSLPPTFCPHHPRMIVQSGTSQL